MRDDFPFARVAGFPVTVHWSVLVILWLFTWSLASTLSAAAPGHSAGAYWLAGAGGSAVLLVSLLAHELSHAVLARRAGVEVSGITLWMFGGLARLRGEAKTPAAEFRIAIAGPVVSVLLAAFFGGTAVMFAALGLPDLVVAVVGWLAGLNLLLALFNLLPGAPLDGGRILRAYLWHRTGDADRAAVGASRAGRIVAMILIGLGLLEFLLGSLVSGVWLAFIGWFLLTAAREEENRILSSRALVGVRVADAMTGQPRTVRDSTTVDEFIHRYLLGGHFSSYPVVDSNGAVVGLIGLAQVRDVEPAHRSTTTVGGAAVPIEKVTTARSSEPLTALLERLQSDPARRALVIDDGRVVGIVTSNDIARILKIRRLVVT